jgi:hypothetical protein
MKMPSLQAKETQKTEGKKERGRNYHAKREFKGTALQTRKQCTHMVRLVAADVKGVVLEDSGHFVPEERPDAVVNEILAFNERLSRTKLPKAV